MILNKLIDEQDKHKHYCNCGHYVYIYPFENKTKKLCTWCHNYVYKDKKEEFKEKIRRRLNNDSR